MDSAAETIFRGILKDKGYSITRTRLAVCQNLWDKEPQTTRQLADSLSGQVDRASVYRTLDLFEKLGLIHRVYIGWKYKVELSDLLTHHHHHISCLACGKVQAITEEQTIERLIASIASKYGSVAKQHQLEIQGYCLECQPHKGA